MTSFLSEPHAAFRSRAGRRCHTLIVGSGYGAAFSALALALRPDKHYGNHEILVLERGHEFVPGDFPATIDELPGHVTFQQGGGKRFGSADALFDVRTGDNVGVVLGNGLGGTSLINAGVAVDPDEHVLALLPPSRDGVPWARRLAPSLALVRAVLRPTAHPRAGSLDKVAALRRLADGLSTLGAEHRLADIAVSFEAGRNAAGVEQTACNDCGNCFTGCNTGAKTTLAMAVWPLLRQLGVRIVTDATVSRVYRVAGDAVASWRAITRTTSAPPAEGDDDPATSVVEASRVILAAGALGSTEILARSRACTRPGERLATSSRVGADFNLNGDGLAFGFAQSARVNAFATAPSSPVVTPASDERPGPTIVSMIAVAGEGRRALIEDATIPQALVCGTGEILAIASLMRRYGGGTPAAWHREHAAADPLAVQPEVLQHHQPLLLMGTDARRGTLAFDPGDDRLALHWPPGAPGAAPDNVAWLDAALERAEATRGFDGGHYVPSPLWRALPKQAASVFEGGEKLGGLHLCNHPLGGCAMGGSGASGVVDADGRVFDGDGTSVHDGLYVLDGGILPAPLGINPYMTIAALAHQLAGRIDGDERAEAYRLPVPTPVALPVRRGAPLEWPPKPMAFEFEERLYGPASLAEATAIFDLLDGADGPRPTPQGLVLDIRVRFPDLEAWLRDPALELDATFRLRRVAEPGRVIDTVPDALIEPGAIAEGEGRVRLFARDGRPRWHRSLRALWRFWLLRRAELWEGSGGPRSLGAMRSFWKVAGEHGHWRELSYRCDRLTMGDREFRLEGRKRLAFDGLRPREERDEANPWITLVNLDVRLTERKTRRHANALFRVDLPRMAKGLRPLQNLSGATTPRVVSAVASVASLSLRVLLHTHLWTFGAPSYAKFPTRRELEERFALFAPPAELRWPGRPAFTVSDALAGNRRRHARRWRLLVAGPLGANARPVLLVHGVAHSSRIYTSETLERSLAGSLLNEGYTVYLLDHGLSCALDQPAGYEPSIEQVSWQVVAAMRKISSLHDGARIQVFAHCIGSAATSMAILRHGHHLRDARGGRLIERLVMHAVPPWIRASESNVLRAYLGVALRANFFPDAIDPLPTRDDGAAMGGAMGQILLDRVGSSIPWSRRDWRAHDHKDAFGRFSRAICNRMTLFYGYDWAHANLSHETHSSLHTLMGRVNSKAYRQLYFFVNRGRVTDGQGANVYVTEPNLRRNWTFPTLFLHGDENETFHFESSRLSAYEVVRVHAAAGVADPPPAWFGRLPGYGHLDAIIGRHAWRDVFPRVHSFFAGETPADPRPNPASDTALPRWPVAGPILSRPRIDVDGRRYLRLWAETTEFHTTHAIELVFVDDRGRTLPRRRGRWIRGAPPPRGLGEKRVPHTLTVTPGHFWLADFGIDDASEPVRCRVRATPRGGDSTPVATGVDGEAHAIELRWGPLPWFQRFVGERTATTPLRFVVGSCRYPGSPFDLPGADRLFGLIGQRVRGLAGDPEGVDHALFLGDQIYADASYGVFDIAEHRERLQESYRQALRTPGAGWVFAHLPCYFAVDDHEFRDSYPTRREGESRAAIEELGEAARLEAYNYLVHHGHLPQPKDPLDNHLWQAFTSRGHRFFVFDTRSERRAAPLGSLHDLLGATQWHAFHEWLIEGTTGRGPLFLATGTPLLPLPLDEIAHPALAGSSDCLRAYPAFLAALVDAVSGAAPGRPIVLMSGDPHFSAVARFTLRRGTVAIDGVAIVASGINSPVPFANSRADEYSWQAGTRLAFPGSDVEVEVHEAELICERSGHALEVGVLPRADGGFALELSLLHESARYARTFEL